MVPPLIVKVPAVVPKAAALLISNVPAFKVTPPVKVLVPESNYVPELTVIAPDVVPMTPVKSSSPAPALVILKVFPPIAPPTVRVLADTATWREALRVTAPVPTLSALLPVNVKSPFQA